MATETYQVEDTHLFSYPIAGGGMRYIEVNERGVYLRNDPNRGAIVRGELSGCGSNCYVDLNQIFLEYALSCGGCKDYLIAEDMADRFAHRLGQVLETKFFHDSLGDPLIDREAFIFKFIFDSMNVPYETTRGSTIWQYELAYCPIQKAAKDGGLSIGVAMAHRIFVALCESLLQSLAPEWTLQSPSKLKSDDPLSEITLVRVGT